MNGTDYDDDDLGLISPVFTASYITLWLIACVMNGVSLCVLCREAHHRLTWANILLCCIAVLDLLLLFLVLLPSVVALFAVRILQDNPSLCYFQGSTLNVLILQLWSVVVFVSVDQYLAICHPFMYSVRVLRHRNKSNKIIFAVLSGCLIVFVLVSTLPIVFGAEFRPLIPALLCYYDLQSQRVQNTITSIITTSLLFINGLIMSYCSSIVGYKFYKIYQQTSQARHSSASHVNGLLPTPANVMDRQQVALAKLVAIIAILFLSCSFPFEVVSLLHLVSFHTSYHIDYFVLCIFQVVTLLNPFMYMFVKASFRRVVLGWFMKGFTLIVEYCSKACCTVNCNKTSTHGCEDTPCNSNNSPTNSTQPGAVIRQSLTESEDVVNHNEVELIDVKSHTACT